MGTCLLRNRNGERDSKRYIEMVEAVSGQEGVETFIVLIESLQAKNDYGADQNTFGALWRFPPNVAAQGLIAALPGLVERHPDYAGDILARLPANTTHHEGLAVLSAFRNALRAAPCGCAENHHGFCHPRRRLVDGSTAAERASSDLMAKTEELGGSFGDNRTSHLISPVGRRCRSASGAAAPPYRANAPMLF